MAWRTVKIPCPNQALFVVRVPGHVIDVLHFQAQILKQSDILDSQGKGKANLFLCIWMLIDEDGPEEDHKFILTQTGQELPAVDAEIEHVGTTLVLLPDGNNLEFTLFYGGESFDTADTPSSEKLTNLMQ